MQIAAIFLFLTFVVIYKVSAETPVSDSNVGGGVTTPSSIDAYEIAKREKELAKKAVKEAQDVYDAKKKKLNELRQKRYESTRDSMGKNKSEKNSEKSSKA